MSDKIEFVSYDGEYPCLCMGTLVVKINDVPYHFHYSWENKRKDPKHAGEIWCPDFWRSGGRAYFENDYRDSIVEHAPWELSASRDSEYDRKNFPEIVLNHLERLIDLFNANVPEGCCGGCI